MFSRRKAGNYAALTNGYQTELGSGSYHWVVE